MLVFRVVLLYEATVKKQWVANIAQDSKDLNILIQFPQFETKTDGYRVYTPPGDKIQSVCQKLQVRVMRKNKVIVPEQYSQPYSDSMCSITFNCSSTFRGMV